MFFITVVKISTKFEGRLLYWEEEIYMSVFLGTPPTSHIKRLWPERHSNFTPIMLKLAYEITAIEF